MNQQDLFKQHKHFFLQPSGLSRAVFGGLIVVGLISFAGGVAVEEGVRTWGSFLFNLMFFFSLALGGVAFGGMQDLVGAQWGRPIKRLHESFGAFVPVGVVCFIIFLLALKFDIFHARHMYSWIIDPHILDHFEGKKVWLVPDFMYIRDFFAAIIIGALCHWHISLTTAADKALLAGDESKARELGLLAKDKLRHWSAPVLFVHALCFSLLSFDLTMSLAPTWFSTLWGGWSFAVMMQSLMAFILLVMFALKATPIGQVLGQQQFHDVGKLLHGFTVFFAYLTFAHVLTYWYVNMPEETSYFQTRLEKPWLYLILLAPVLSFVIPFFALIPKVSKWKAGITVPICLTVLVAQWISYLLVVTPEIVKPENWGLPWIEVGVFLGFLGAFMLMFTQHGKKIPMVAVADPLLAESLAGHH